MCRHLAYLGPPIALSSLLFDAPHALRTQARTPRHQPEGRTNPHGWGIAWHPDAGAHATPEHYRSETPIWDDDAFSLGTEHATAVVAAARFASPGTTLDVCNNAPFVSSRWSFSLNGFGFHREREVTLRDALSPERREALVGDTDTEVLFGLVLDRLDRGADPATALRDVTELVDPGDDVRLNMLLGDGTTIVATAWGNSLFVLSLDDRLVVASEPLDDNPAWMPVPDRSVVDGSRLTPIGGSR